VFRLSDAQWYASTLFIGGVYALTLIPRAAPDRVLILVAVGLFSLTAGFLLWRRNPVGKLMGMVVMILIALWGIVTWKLYQNRLTGAMLIGIGWISAWLFFRIDLKRADRPG